MNENATKKRRLLCRSTPFDWIGNSCWIRPSGDLFGLLNDGFESLGVVDSEVGEHLTVDLDTGLVESTHELRIAQAFEASRSVDTLNPECAEVALLVATIAEGVGQTFLPSILGNGPDVFASTIVSAGQFQDSLALSARCDVIY